MRSFFIVAALGASAFASETINERFVHHPANVLEKRQQFAPSTQMATGDTCAAAFGTGYVTCREKSGASNRLCYNPDIGQACCQNSWACPTGSVCLPNDGQCCPTGACPASALLASGNSTSTSSNSTTTRTGSPTGYLNGTSTLTKPTATQTSPSSAKTSAVTGGVAMLKLEAAGSLVGLVGLAAALL